ncbi:hypothetical protein [Sulfuricurvum sp.]|uniref:hypothetical protein n=1 Tax=Sulfuricurvum sp. TaxID=2025608 RepID=UPI002603DCA6|nr:hypothetical protein [Sulfuricurvum sp.]MDD3597655.1 hypothetical protein [Sulfuricurvum sp.]
MQTNVIYLSDASYDDQTKSAGIGIKNLTTFETLCMSIQADGVGAAEEYALIIAIEHALQHNHRNCVFVYDHLYIDTKALHTFYAGMFEKLQFMWFKREYLYQVDRLASMARPKKAKEKFSRLALLRKQIPTLREEVLVTMFMSLTRGETYGYLAAISQSAPVYREFPKGISNANQMVICLLSQLGNKPLREKLFERFGAHNALRHIALENFLAQVGFDESWIEDARYECRGLDSA